jgi:hypothetical protein
MQETYMQIHVTIAKLIMGFCLLNIDDQLQQNLKQQKWVSSHKLTKSIRSSPSSWKALTSCHYFPMTLSAPNSGVDKYLVISSKFLANKYTKIGFVSFCHIS